MFSNRVHAFAAVAGLELMDKKLDPSQVCEQVEKRVQKKKAEESSFHIVAIRQLLRKISFEEPSIVSPMIPPALHSAMA